MLKMPVIMPANCVDVIIIYHIVNDKFAKISAGKNADVLAAIKHISKSCFFELWFAFMHICGENRRKYELM